MHGPLSTCMGVDNESPQTEQTEQTALRTGMRILLSARTGTLRITSGSLATSPRMTMSRGCPQGPPFVICIAVDNESPHSWQICTGAETAVENSDTRLSAGAVVALRLGLGYGYGLGLRLLLDAEAEYPAYGTPC
jgi:hypothetical protein